MRAPVTSAQQLAAFAAGLSDAGLPADVSEQALLHLLETLGCGLAALALGEVTFVLSAAIEAGGTGPATAIGSRDGLPAAGAALVNGTLFHALDFDDTHPDSVVHVSAAVVAAALAAGEAAGSSGAGLVRALVIGNETSARIGMAAGGRFHARGFHPTGVCGVFGATAAAASLRGLDEERFTHALGIAGSMAGGLFEFLADGTKTKPLHPGWAAHAALMAVGLAAHGATGPATVLEGSRGFFAAYLHGEDHDLEAQLADLGARWETPQMAFKPYPACHYIHAPLDALASLMRDHGLGPQDVEGIVALSDETGVGLVLHPLADKLRPRTAYDAKFSLPYCLGAMLVHGRVNVGSFTAEAIADPAVLELAARVTYEQKDYAAAPDAFPGGVRVTTRDGRTLEAELRHQRGGAQNPMAAAEIIAKFEAGAELALPGERVAELRDAVRGLDNGPDLRALAVLRGAGPRS
ncbi:unannotated protein [freshwater metagenome]|uniref:Unannotated protein n=1 Tax=freshwater metagenome TaxID=449393 RepID=A0A6J7EBP4_9ZZZZ|nr:MmgE/PrpD family protein [Actinomycetota bacterium]